MTSPPYPGLWRLADPKISLASFAAMLLGLAAAWADGPVHWGWAAVTILGIFAIEVAKNAAGEVVDWDHGVDQAVAAEDRSPFSGGKRVLVDGLLTRGQARAIALVCYLIGVGAGVAGMGWKEPAILPYCVIGLGLAWSYHGAPLRLAYRGVGELAVGLAYGPVLVAGTYLLQRGAVPPYLWWLAAPLGLLIALFLVANEFPDYAADRGAAKRTLVVRLGRPRAARLYLALVFAAALLIGLPPLAGLTPPGAIAGAIAIPAAIQSARIVMTHAEDTPALVPGQARMLLAFVLYAGGAAVGVANSEW